MNPHRLHTLDIPAQLHRRLHPVTAFTPEDPSAERFPVSTAVLVFLVVTVAAWLGAYLLVLEQRDTQTRAERAATTDVYELPPITVEAARIEGFRAGMATAAAEGCPATTLSQPLDPQ